MNDKIKFCYHNVSTGSAKKQICGCCIKVRAGVSVRVSIRVKDRVRISNRVGRGGG